MVGIGYNCGLGVVSSYYVYCWSVVCCELLGVWLFIEVVWMQVCCVCDLGLDYKIYVGVWVMIGCDLVVFFYFLNVLGVFCKGQLVVVFVVMWIVVSVVQLYLGCVMGFVFDVLVWQIGVVLVWDLLFFGVSWLVMCNEMKVWLCLQGLLGDVVLMIGEIVYECEMMVVGGLVGFVSGQMYFVGVVDVI